MKGENKLSPNVSLWPVGYFDLKSIKVQMTQGKLTYPLSTEEDLEFIKSYFQS